MGRIGALLLLGSTLVGLPRAVLAQAPPAARPAPTREASLIDAFQVMCDLERPDFDRIDAHATAMRMRLQEDTRGPGAQNTVIRHKGWVGGLTDGPFFLYDDEMSGAKGVATDCAVGGPVPDVDRFRAAAIAALHLAPEPQPEWLPEGSRTFVWPGARGPGTSILVRDLTPSGKPGIMIKRGSMVHGGGSL